MFLPRGPRALLLCALLLAPATTEAQSRPTLLWGGEIRPRAETGKAGEAGREQLVSMRTRVVMDARFEEGLRLYFQFQDVRNWGEETTERDRTADALDFHQAFLEVEDLPAAGGTLRAGRQEVALAEERFIGAPDWGQAGQTFDGALWFRPVGSHRLELVALKLREESSPAHQDEAELLAAWFAVSPGGMGSGDLLALHDRSTGPGGSRQHTLGGVWRIDPAPFSFRVQAMGQLGEREGRRVRASMLAIRAGAEVLEGKGTVTLWYDRLSGDETPDAGDVRSFSALYGARNRYYGTADYFTDIPRDTGGLGLQDAVLKLTLSPHPLLSLYLDLHAFRTAARGSLESRRLGEEMDAWLRYRFREALAVQVGYSLIRSGPVLEALERLDGTGQFGYVMTSLRF